MSSDSRFVLQSQRLTHDNPSEDRACVNQAMNKQIRNRTQRLRLFTLSPKRAVSAFLFAYAVLLVVAFSRGLPISFLRDERNQIYYYAHLGTTFPDLEYFLYGFLPQFVHFMGYALGYVTLRAIGFISSASEFKMMLLTNESLFVGISRFINVILGSLTVCQAGAIAYRLGGAKASVLCFFGLLVSPFSLVNATTANVDQITVFFVVMAGWCVVVAGTQDMPGKMYAWAATFIGLGAACKYYPVIYLVPLFVAIVLHDGKRTTAVRQIFVATAVTVMALIVASPPMYLQPADFREGILELARVQVQGTPYTLLGRSRWEFYMQQAFPYYVSVPTIAFWAVDVGRGILDRDRTKVALHLFPAITIAMLIHHPSVGVRFLMPAIPFVMIGASCTVSWICGLRVKTFIRHTAFLFAIFLIFVPRIGDVQDASDAARYPDTRELARKWIEENIAEGTTVARESHWAGGGLHQFNPQLLSIEKKKRIELLRDEVHDNRTPYLRKLTIRPAYQLVDIKRRKPELVASLKGRAQYCVLSSGVYGRYLDHSDTESLESQFYRTLFRDREFTIVRRFTPEPGERVGPTIIIYKIRGQIKAQ